MPSTESFQRLSIGQRGHFSNHFTLMPVRTLEFSDSALTIQSWETKSYPYESLKADIIDTYRAKGYGSYSHAYIKQTLVSIRAGRHTFKFDLSSQFPDFRPPKRVLALIEEHISCTHRKIPLIQVKRRHWLFALVFLSLLAAACAVTKWIEL